MRQSVATGCQLPLLGSLCLWLAPGFRCVQLCDNPNSWRWPHFTHQETPQHPRRSSLWLNQDIQLRGTALSTSQRKGGANLVHCKVVNLVSPGQVTHTHSKLSQTVKKGRQ